MRREMMILVTVVLMIFITGGETYPGLILRGPETQTRPEGGSELFVCTAQGDVSWFINGQWLSYGYEDDLEDIGFTFSETRVSGTTYPTTNMTMTVPATNALNRTEIQCKTVGSDGIQVSSDVAWLWIAAPPLPPNVSLELTSWNTMQLSWAAPFTTEGFPIVKYIVYTTNTTTEQRTRIDIYPTTGSETHTIQDTPSYCHTLQFEVLAENSVGTSTAGVVSGGFPVAVSEFQVNVSVVFLQTSFTPQATISFQLPDICVESGVSATYVMEVKMSSDLVLKMAAVYWHSVLIEEPQPLEASESYTVNVTVFVPSYADLGSFTVIRGFDTYIPTASTNEGTTGDVSSVTSATTPTTENVPSATATTPTTENVPSATATTPTAGNVTSASTSFHDTYTPKDTASTGVKVELGTSATAPLQNTSIHYVSSDSEGDTYMPIMLGTIGVLLLLTILIGAGLVAVYVRQQRRKTIGIRSSAPNGRPLPPMATNPIYDVSPVYDVIPEPCDAKPHNFQKQHSTKSLSSFDPRYSSTPTSLTLPNKVGTQMRPASMSQSPLSPNTPSPSPNTPSPKEIDALLLCNTFAGAPSPLSHQQSQTRRMDWGREDSGIYTLSKHARENEEQVAGGEKGEIRGDVEKEDCYVLMQSHVV